MRVDYIEMISYLVLSLLKTQNDLALESTEGV